MKPIPPEYNKDIHRLILKVRKLMLTSRLLRGSLIWLTVSLGLWLVLLAADNLLHLPAGLRLAISLGGLGLMSFELWHLLLQPVMQRDRLESVTLFLESKFAIPENMLINALCFETARLSPKEEPFAQETIKTGSEMMTKANFNELWQHKKLARWATALLILIILWLLFGICRGHQLANSLLRYVTPLGDVPPAGSVVLRVTPAGDIFMAEGDDLVIVVEVMGLIILIRATISRDRAFISGDREFFATIISVGIVFIIFMASMQVLASLPDFGTPVFSKVPEAASNTYISEGFERTGAANLVASVILDFRAYDTLGEATVLFTSVIGATVILRRKTRKLLEEPEV